MKRTILLTLVFCFFAGNLLAQQDTLQNKTSEWSRWSIYLKGGIDIPKASEGFFKRSYYDPEFGIGIERSFNSLFGLGLDYMYMGHTNEVYDARIHQINLTAPVNLSNLLSPCRKWQKLNIFFNPGLGFGIGGHDEYTYEGVKHSSESKLESMNLTLGMGAEYDISSHFAVGVDAQYRWNSNTGHAPHLTETNKYGDYGYYGVNLSVRYKFAGKDNIRNTNQLAERCHPKEDDRLNKLEKELKDLKDQLQRDKLNADTLKALKNDVDNLRACCTSNTACCDEIKAIIAAPKPTAPKEITLRSIYYKLNESDLLPASYTELNIILDLMQKNPDYVVEVGSNTDSRGHEAYNFELSRKRAQAVVDYLVSKGINKDRLITKGYGETQLLNKCKDGVKCTEAEHAINRRTVFTVLNHSSVVADSELIDNPYNY